MTRLLPFAAVLALAACADAPPDAAAANPGARVAPPSANALAVAAHADGPAVAYVDSLRRLVVRPADAAPVVVDGGPVSSNSQAGPRLASLADGALVVAYATERTVEGRRFPASDLNVARSEDGGRTWSAPVRPYADPGFPTGHTFHSLAVGPDGSVVVAWLDGTARDRWRRSAGTAARHAGHVPVRLVHDGPHHNADHHHGPDRSSAKRSNVEPGTDLRAAVSMDGGRTFGPPATVAIGTCPCCRTALHIADDGTAYAVWRHIFPDSVRDVALARSADGGATWSEPVRVHADGWTLDGCPHAGPAVTTDAEGAVHVAWPTLAEGRGGLWRAVSTDGGATFAEPVAIASPAPLGQLRAARHDGRAVFAVEDRGAISVVAVGAMSDTLRVQGSGADLAAGPDAFHLLWHDGNAVRLHSSAP